MLRARSLTQSFGGLRSCPLDTEHEAAVSKIARVQVGGRGAVEHLGNHVFYLPFANYLSPDEDWEQLQAGRRPLPIEPLR